MRHIYYLTINIKFGNGIVNMESGFFVDLFPYHSDPFPNVGDFQRINAFFESNYIDITIISLQIVQCPGGHYEKSMELKSHLYIKST